MGDKVTRSHSGLIVLCKELPSFLKVGGRLLAPSTSVTLQALPEACPNFTTFSEPGWAKGQRVRRRSSSKRDRTISERPHVLLRTPCRPEPEAKRPKTEKAATPEAGQGESKEVDSCWELFGFGCRG